MPSLEDIQQRVGHLQERALRDPEGAEGRTAAVAALRLIREHGLLILRPEQLATFVLAPPPPSPPAKRPRRTKPRRPIPEVVNEAANGITTTLDAAGRVASSVNAFASIFGGRRR